MSDCWGPSGDPPEERRECALESSLCGPEAEALSQGCPGECGAFLQAERGLGAGVGAGGRQQIAPTRLESVLTAQGGSDWLYVDSMLRPSPIPGFAVPWGVMRKAHVPHPTRAEAASSKDCQPPMRQEVIRLSEKVHMCWGGWGTQRPHGGTLDFRVASSLGSCLEPSH